MNKHNILFSLWCLAIVSSITLINGCKSEPGDTGPKDHHLATADSIVSQYNAGRPDWDRTVKMEGNVNIKVKEGRVSIDLEADNASEFMNYFFQTEHKEHGLKTDSFGRAEVIYLERMLIVNSLSKKKTLVFSIDLNKEPSFLKDLNDPKMYYGYGIGLRKITKGSAPEKAPYCACDQSSTPPGNCKSGGVLSLNCATSNVDGSCRVTCSGQTYACCDRGFE